VNYQETVEYLFNQLPFFQRQGAEAYKPKLHNTIELCKFLGNPQDQLKHIHVAGTNGKGSTSHLLAAILAQHGYKVGLYTSPHLKSFTERIKINGIEMPEQDVVEFVDYIKPQIEYLQPSFFELTVAMAFWYFKKEEVDICVVEVGMGGRLDSTNVITPLVTVITNISLDHQQYLGNTIELIAREKAGIIKPQIPVVVGEIQEETLPVFIEIASALNAPVKTFLMNYTRLKNSLTNSYQDKNIETVLKTIEVLEEQGFRFDDTKLKFAISDFKSVAGLKGRWQTLSEKPLMICDTGHNEAGIQEVVKMLGLADYSKLHIVIGMVAEKEVETVLSLLPQKALYYFCQANNPRSMKAEQLALKASKKGLLGESFNSVEDAIQSAQNRAEESDLIFIGGSTFVVAEIPFL
jgi:dihydrofolate synthase / folylpolyglutamate synthase